MARPYSTRPNPNLKPSSSLGILCNARHNATSPYITLNGKGTKLNAQQPYLTLSFPINTLFMFLTCQHNPKASLKRRFTPKHTYKPSFWADRCPKKIPCSRGFHQKILHIGVSMPSKIYPFQNNSSKRNLKLKMKTSLKVIDIIARRALFIRKLINLISFVLEERRLER